MSSTLTISIEIELAWGVHDLDDRSHLSSDGRPERAALRRLLSVADECDVPITFDIVGHLLLDECDGDHDGPHDAGWFDADPGTDVEADPLFYAPDAAEAVLAADADHELSTHTFSHVDCEAVSAETLDWELRRARTLHEDVGAPIRSLVPPRHYEPPNEALREHGIRCVRYAKPTGGKGYASRAQELSVGPHPLWEPRVVDGVLETYCTTYPSLTASSLPSGASPEPAVCRPVPAATRRWLHGYYLRRSTRRAVRTGRPLHLWCHLYDLANPHQIAVVESYLRYLADVPESDLRVLTMADLASEYLAPSASPAAASERP